MYLSEGKQDINGYCISTPDLPPLTLSWDAQDSRWLKKVDATLGLGGSGPLISDVEKFPTSSGSVPRSALARISRALLQGVRVPTAMILFGAFWSR